MALNVQQRPEGTGAQKRSTSLIWSPAGLAGWGGVVAVTAIAALVMWYVIGGEKTWNAQVPYMDVAILMVIISSAAQLSFLQAGRRAVGLRRRSLLGEPSAEVNQHANTPIYAQFNSEAIVTNLFVAGPNLRHFHLPSCPMAAGRPWPEASRYAHTTAGRTPCDVCRP